MTQINTPEDYKSLNANCFSALLGITVDKLTSTCVNELNKYDFRYHDLNMEEYEKVLLMILTKLDNHSFSISGSEKREQWQKVWQENLSYKNILQSVENSLRRLKTDYIDLYSVHWPNQKYGAEEISSAFLKLREQGKIINIGVCNYSLDRVKEFQKYVPNIFAIQNEYNLVDRSVEDDLLPYCQSNSMHLISYSPLDQGKIMQDGVLQKIAINIIQIMRLDFA